VFEKPDVVSKTLRKRPSICLMCVAVLLMVGISQVDPGLLSGQSPTEQAKSKFIETFKLARAANEAGATNEELFGLARELNRALQIIGECNRLEQEGETAQAQKLAQDAISLLSNVESNATVLRTRSEQRVRWSRVLTYFVALVSAMLLAIAYYYGMEVYRRYRTAKTMSMTVKVISDGKQK